MRKNMKKLVVIFLTMIMLVLNAMPVSAATSKYGEDKPLKTVTKSYYIKSNNGAAHKHWYIDATNGVRYFLYDLCMSGMVSSTPTNHLSTVTIDGVKYSLRNYRRSNQYWIIYANVIKKIGGSSTTASSSTTKKTALRKITLNKDILYSTHSVQQNLINGTGIRTIRQK